MTKRMTNFDKFRMIEIDGARLFEHQNKEAVVEILGCMDCEDCPVSDECEGDSRCCDEMLAKWRMKRPRSDVHGGSIMLKDFVEDAYLLLLFLAQYVIIGFCFGCGCYRRLAEE